MAKPYYVKFEIPENLVSPIYESLRVAVETGKVKRGTNEATKAIERGVSKLIIIAEDVEPPEVVAHLPIICEEQGAAYVFVPSKQELGKALGIEVICAAAAILDSGDAQHIIDEVIASIAKIKDGKSEPEAEPEPEPEPEAEPEPEVEPEPEATQPVCGPGTVLKNGLCVAEQQQRGGGCLIATAAFGSELAPQIQFLREIRDNTVLQTQSGSAFMAGFNQFYYSFSPTIADYERENPAFKEAVKLTLTPLLTSLTLLQYADIDSESEMLGYGIGVILLNIGMYFVAPAVIIFKIKNRK